MISTVQLLFLPIHLTLAPIVDKPGVNWIGMERNT
jgi:hypothetical protein